MTSEDLNCEHEPLVENHSRISVEWYMQEWSIQSSMNCCSELCFVSREIIVELSVVKVLHMQSSEKSLSHSHICRSCCYNIGVLWTLMRSEYVSDAKFTTGCAILGHANDVSKTKYYDNLFCVCLIKISSFQDRFKTVSIPKLHQHSCKNCSIQYFT